MKFIHSFIHPILVSFISLHYVKFDLSEIQIQQIFQFNIKLLRTMKITTNETVTVSVKYLGEGTCQLLAGSLQEGDILVYERQSGNPMMMMGF